MIFSDPGLKTPAPSGSGARDLRWTGSCGECGHNIEISSECRRIVPVRQAMHDSVITFGLMGRKTTLGWETFFSCSGISAIPNPAPTD